MARRRKNKPVATFYREGHATYGPHTYRYEVWKDSGSFFITYGRKGPFTQAEREEDIETYAQEILELCIEEFIEESEKRLKAHYFGTAGEKEQ